MKLRSYIRLAHLARRRLRSYDDYLVFQQQQARMLRDYLEQHDIRLKQKRVLDLGSGLGGYTIEWEADAEWVVALDLGVSSPAIREAGIPFVHGDACDLPLLSSSFDVIFCASLIEHVDRPVALLREIERVLHPAGICYLSFPPFYSPRGGHEFSPFHYLGEKAALKLTQRDRHVPDWLRDYYDITPSAKSFAKTYQGWGLHRVTIARACRWITEVGLTIRRIDTRYLSLNLATIPILREVLAWHVQMILEHPESV
jgi:ubiquinone/menaquinone biosynthesis C-methylase UbiE